MTLYQAHLVGVYQIGELPEELQGFVRYQASHLRHTPQKGDKVAVLQVLGTTSYFPIFLQLVHSIEEVEKQLMGAEAELDQVSRVSLERVIQENIK